MRKGVNRAREVLLGCLFILLTPANSAELPAKSFAALGSQDFAEREKAEIELLAWGRQQPDFAMKELLQQSRTADDPEVRARCLSVLRGLVMDEYLNDGEGYLGIMMADAIENVPGDDRPRVVIHVIQVMPDSAAKRAGLQLNDVIVGLNELVWYEGNVKELFSDVIKSKKPKTKVTLKVIRDGKLIEVGVVLGRRPPLQNNLLFGDPSFDPEAIERADKEAYFRRWLSARKP